jgi:hypothetical protein
MLPVSNDTVLRIFRSVRAHVPTHPLNVVGIADWLSELVPPCGQSHCVEAEPGADRVWSGRHLTERILDSAPASRPACR